LTSYDKPFKDEVVSNIEKNQTLYKAFHFIPGQKIMFKVTNSGKEEKTTWEVQTDIYNNSCIYCEKTKSKAWFKNDGSIHYFTHFEGNKKSLLFYFYLGAYKVIFGFYKGLTISDQLPINTLNNKCLIFLQDFIAPFYRFIKSEYSLEYARIKDNLTDSQILLISGVLVKRNKKVTKELNFEFAIESNRIQKFVVVAGNKTIEAEKAE